MTPDEFRKEYVEPAVELWRQHQTVTHLAANAIAQLDALADVVWLGQGKPGRVAAFRDALGQREPSIAVVRDACDSHKHGALQRATATHISGERPTTVTAHGIFAGSYRAGGRRTPYDILVIRKLDGTEHRVSNMLFDAMQAWRREFERLGYETDWLVLGYQHRR